MNKILYNVGMIDNGNLVINLPEKYVANPSDKYFSLLYTKYFLLNVYNDYLKNETKNPEMIEGLGNTINFIDGVSFEMEKILKAIYRENAKLFDLAITKQHISVDTEEDLQEIISNAVDGEILIEDMLFNIESGLTVFVRNENSRYTYFDGELIKIDE